MVSTGSQDHIMIVSMSIYSQIEDNYQSNISLFEDILEIKVT